MDERGWCLGREKNGLPQDNVALLDDEWTEGQRVTIEAIGGLIKKAGWEFYPVDLTPSLRFGLFNWWW